MNICQSKKSIYSIMNNPHFGGIKLTKGKATLFIPEEWINADGSLKGHAQKRWKCEIAKHEEHTKVV